MIQDLQTTDLSAKIAQKTARIAVVGLGYVGLPLGIEFAKAGFQVLGIEDNPAKAQRVNRGDNYIFEDQGALQGLVEGKKIRASSDYDLLRDVDVIIICVPTPLTKHREPDISYVASVTDHIAKTLRRGQLVVLESTTYPGTTEELVLPHLSSSGLKIGEDFHLAFSPERVDPGNKEFHTGNIPKVIGGVTPKCTELACKLYGQVLDEVHPASSPRVAEMEKLLENIFRSVNIALVNELAILCRKMDIDIWEVVDLASTKPYGFMPFYPGPGLGGHCIPVDPFYLTWKAREYDFATKFIELAGEINANMPAHVVTMIVDALGTQRKSLRGANVLVLGAAYKKDVADVRESPALRIMELLIKRGALVSYNDPLIMEITLGSAEELRSVPVSDFSRYDCVVIATNHSVYDYERVVKDSKLVVDTHNATRSKGSAKVFVL
ncbi:MAG: nucleotide sugar dehydrogenase [Armatimonadetes bacterium]|nr:nucleotide sugar dehydrogenase [Armatimonadota bacterium]